MLMSGKEKADKHVMPFSLYKNIDSVLKFLCLRGVKVALNMMMLSGLMMALTACQTTDIAATDLSCDVFGPISWSKNDSIQTSKQVREHNAAWVSLCINDVNN